MYENEFNEALKRTQKFGLSIPSTVSLNQDRFLSKKVQEELPIIIHESLGVLDEDDILLQCLLLNMRLKDVFTKYFGCPVYYTIGYIGLNDSFVFEQTEKSLLSMLETGIEGPSVSLHAWLTLPSMEILDFSFGTSYGTINEQPEMIGRAVALHPSELTGGMSFHPMIIGEEFLYKIGGMKLVLEKR